MDLIRALNFGDISVAALAANRLKESKASRKEALLALKKKSESTDLPIALTNTIIRSIQFLEEASLHPGALWARQHPEAHAAHNFPRHEDDGRCVFCERWGCVACHGTGGY